MIKTYSVPLHLKNWAKKIGRDEIDRIHWHYRNVSLAFAMAFIMTAILLLVVSMARGEVTPPDNLWQGLIAEDTSGDYQIYLAISSVVRNRLNRGLNHGLVALNRKNLNEFVVENYLYVLKTKNIDLQIRALQAILEVFSGKDYANGAIHYEHTKIYSIPKWAKNMQVVKIIYQGTKQEITFWK